MKKVIVTSCSHSHGRPMERVTTSHVTVTVNPVIATPHSTISTRSSGSSARHFRWRCVAWTSDGMAEPLLNAAHEPEDLYRVGPEIVGELILDRLAPRLEAALVDPADDLDADFLQPRARFLLHL